MFFSPAKSGGEARTLIYQKGSRWFKFTTTKNREQEKNKSHIHVLLSSEIGMEMHKVKGYMQRTREEQRWGDTS